LTFDIPVLFGGGTQLVEHSSLHSSRETVEVIETAEVIHLRFRRALGTGL